jgi:hypothetical protein
MRIMNTKRSLTTALLWFLGGLAFLVAWLLSSPRPILTMVAAVLFFLVAAVTLWRGRKTPSPPAT